MKYYEITWKNYQGTEVISGNSFKEALEKTGITKKEQKNIWHYNEIENPHQPKKVWNGMDWIIR